MCGIAGFVGKSAIDQAGLKIEKMLSTIVHRGPDGEGKQVFEDRIALGHRRLAVLDLSDNGLQPMQWKGKYWITYNGEIYNYKELKKILEEEKGVIFKTETDTEVILAAYDKWGIDCVSKFNGMWAFAIYDKEKEMLFCSRDRFGVKPFYYATIHNTFIFASEIKEILTWNDSHPPRVDRDHLEAFLVSGIMDTDSGTMFKDIYQLEEGHNLILEVNSLKYKICKWYELKDIKLNNNQKEENWSIFGEKFTNSIKLRLHADVPIGSCLSGGLDSSAIVCVANRILRESGNDFKQCSVTSCFKDQSYDEQEYADAVTEKTGTITYKTYPDLDKFFDNLDKIIWHMDEPFISMSMFAQWEVFKEARKQGLVVMLDGQGADEQLAGYTAFYSALFFDLLKKGDFVKLKRELKMFNQYRAGIERVSIGKRILSLIGKSVFPAMLTSYMGLVYENFRGMLPYEFKQYRNPVIRKKERLCNLKDARQFTYGDIHTGLKALLHFEDRDSMAHSIEARVPFLDVDLVEFIFSVPIDQKIEDGKTKNILREGVKKELPEKVYRRYGKFGFVTPQDKWMNQNKEQILKEFENGCERLSRIFDMTGVKKWYYDNCTKKMELAAQVAFRVICAAHWIDVFEVEA